MLCYSYAALQSGSAIMATREREPSMNPAPAGSQFTITILPGQQGAEFDQTQLQLPLGAVTVWVNQTDTAQVVLSDNAETRRVMTLAPKGQDGATWMMRMRSSQQRAAPAGPLR
jgi:hypothetical protein